MSSLPTNEPNFAIMVARLSASKQWDRAFDYAREWLAAEPENLRAHLAAGQAAVQLNRYEEARLHIERVLSGEPENDFAFRLLSIIQFNLGENAAADDSIHRAISIDPNDAFNWYHLGWMCYRQGANAAARDCLVKARELAPNDPNIINLLTLCEPETPAANARKLEQYKQALDLDPENADVHNNLGVYYLDAEKNPELAEECFRRSLALDPTSKLARHNLFVTIKKRDIFYRVLNFPRDVLISGIGLVRKSRGRNVLLFIGVLAAWIYLAQFVIAGLALWFMFFWPVVKVYERLTIGDIRSAAGEIGARRGGLFGYRRWPLRVRMGIFLAILAAFWGGAGWCYWRFPEESKTILGTALVGIFLSLIGWSLWAVMRRSRIESHGKKRAKVVRSLLEPEPVKKSWWEFFRRKPVSNE